MEKSEHPIRAWRIAQKVTQDRLCKAVGCKGSHLSLIEKGVNRPSFDLAKRIAKETGLSLEDIRGGKQ